MWGRIRAAILAGGRFSGELLGDRDTWASLVDHTAINRPAVEALFDGWIVELFEEEENDGEAFGGPKHWHYFHVVAKCPGALRRPARMCRGALELCAPDPSGRSIRQNP